MGGGKNFAYVSPHLIVQGACMNFCCALMIHHYRRSNRCGRSKWLGVGIEEKAENEAWGGEDGKGNEA